MKKVTGIYLLLFCCSFGVVSAMSEEKKPLEQVSADGKTIADLPPELHAYIGQFLGSTIDETIRNLLTLSQVSRHFNRVLKSNPDAIARVIEQRFGKENILAEFGKLLKPETGFIDTRRVIPFIKLSLVTPEDVEQLNAISPGWVYYAFKNAQEIKNQLGKSNAPAVNDAYKLITWLLEAHPVQKKPLIDPNKEYKQPFGGSLIPLLHAVQQNDKELWDLLVKYGADLSSPLNKRAVEWAKNRRERGWIKSEPVKRGHPARQ